MKKYFLSAITLFFVAYSQAHVIQLDNDLPEAVVSDKGELVLKNQEITEQI